ncbi:MAG: hypothetical protein PHP45_03875, partial [Elusimicrobiales bacterium]|nr:hypothetical protein [Elusimicrobiales bacterium]
MAKEMKMPSARQLKKHICRNSVIHEDSAVYGAATHREQRVSTIAVSRKYTVASVNCAKSIASGWLKTFRLEKAVGFGLPEVDDRYHIWRVPLLNPGTNKRIGEVVIDAYTSLVTVDETTAPDVVEARLLGRNEPDAQAQTASRNSISLVRNTVVLGDSESALLDMPSQSVDLIFTSPP